MLYYSPLISLCRMVEGGEDISDHRLDASAFVITKEKVWRVLPYDAWKESVNSRVGERIRLKQISLLDMQVTSKRKEVDSMCQ